MHEKRSHKVSRSALAISLAACVALCVTVTPDEKAYADSGYTEVQLLEYIETRLHEISITLESIGYTASPNPATHTTIYDLINLNAINTNAVYNILERIESDLVDSSSNSSFASLIRNHLNTWNPYFVYFNSWQESVNINGTTYYTPIHYLKQTYGKLDMVYQAIIMSNETLWQADSYMDENQQTHFTPYYYLKQIYNSLNRNNNSAALYLDGIRVNSYTTANTITTMNNTLSSLATVVNQIRDNLSYNSTSSAGYLSSINAKMDTLHSDLNYQGQSVASYLYGIYDATQTIIDYMIRLANNTSAPNPNIADSLIGDFDDDAFSANMEDLQDEIAGIGVFGCITVLGTYIEIMTDVEELQQPQLVFPFEFGGFQNQSVTVNVSWLDDLKPAINYFLEFMLVMGLTFLTWEAVKET